MAAKTTYFLTIQGGGQYRAQQGVNLQRNGFSLPLRKRGHIRRFVQFQDQKEKRQYLSVLKTKSVKYSRVTSKNSVYATGIYYVTKTRTVKIYDKGEEFKIHDFKKLKLSKFLTEADLDNLKYFSKKCLRYEMEFRPQFHKRYIRDQINLYKEKKKSPFASYMIEHLGKEIFDNEYCHKNNLHDLNFHPGSPNFLNKRLYSRMIRAFYDFLKEYQITNVPVNTLEAKVDHHNKSVEFIKITKEKKINITGIKRFVEDLQKFGRDRLLRMGMYKPRTYYNYMGKLKALGYDKPEIITPFSFTHNFSLESYHDNFF